MPSNKNALARMMVLDEMLSSKYHWYSISEMTDNVNDRLQELGLSKVTDRCIRKDIRFMTGEYSPFEPVDLDSRLKLCSYCDDNGKECEKLVKAYRYDKSGYSIFNREWTKEERMIMKVVFRMLGQFDGLPNFDKLENMRIGYRNENETSIVHITRNPLEHKNLFGKLFSCISNKESIILTFHTFEEPNKRNTITIFPYLLKEYNRRWYLFGASSDTNEIRRFGLERIDNVEACPELQYKEYDGCWDEDYFSDIIGVTNPNTESLKILFWVDDKQKEYIKTKPMHDSQTLLKNDKLQRMKYSQLQGGAFFTIECKRNYELTRELCSFGSSLLVLSPNEVCEDVKKWITSMYNLYYN